MPVYEVHVQRLAEVRDTLVVQAANEDEARTIAENAADGWDFESYDTDVSVLSELTADEALDRASEVVT